MAGLSAENPFKDVFNRRVLEGLGRRIKREHPVFDDTLFVQLSMHGLQELGLFERSDHICECLKQTLPDEFPEAVRILVAALDDPLPDPGKTDWDSFIVMPQTRFVARYGQGHYDLSMAALYQMTQRFTAENDLRTFIELDYQRTMKLLQKWAKDPSHHVRRLVSEGTRCRLPMTGRIRRFIEDPRPVFELLELLKDDGSLYVRRSVANNLNDISKDNPDLMLDLLERWSVDAGDDRRWLIRHALRTLIKKGNARALKLAGADTTAKASLSTLRMTTKRINIGETARFAFRITSEAKKKATYIVDYDLFFKKKDGSLKPKRFKLRRLTLQPGESRLVEAQFRAVHTSGRTIYPGRHEIEVHVNGAGSGRLSFQIVE